MEEAAEESTGEKARGVPSTRVSRLARVMTTREVVPMFSTSAKVLSILRKIHCEWRSGQLAMLSDQRSLDLWEPTCDNFQAI